MEISKDHLCITLKIHRQAVPLKRWGKDLSGTMQGAGGTSGLLHIRDHAEEQGYFVAYDGKGNVSALVDEQNGETAARYAYAPFGQLAEATGEAAHLNPFRFSTRYHDTETGLYYYGYRYYDPVTGRWPSRDPIGERGGLNLYAMVGNNAVSRFDRLGLQGAEAAVDWDNDPFGFEEAQRARQALVDYATADIEFECTSVIFGDCETTLCDELGKAVQRVADQSRSFSDFRTNIFSTFRPVYETISRRYSDSTGCDPKGKKTVGEENVYDPDNDDTGLRCCKCCLGFKLNLAENGSDNYKHFAGIMAYGHIGATIQGYRDYGESLYEDNPAENFAEIEANYESAGAYQDIVSDLKSLPDSGRFPQSNAKAWKQIKGSMGKRWKSRFCELNR